MEWYGHWHSLTTTFGDDDDDGGEIYVVQEIKRTKYRYIAPNISHKWSVKK
jgi:hypothetical protein